MGIWPKYSVWFGNTQNVLRGYRIWALSQEVGFAKLRKEKTIFGVVETNEVQDAALSCNRDWKGGSEPPPLSLPSIPCSQDNHMIDYLSWRICSRISVISALKCCISIALSASTGSKKIVTQLIILNTGSKEGLTGIYLKTDNPCIYSLFFLQERCLFLPKPSILIFFCRF